MCPDAVVIEEQFTGATLDRPGWKKLMQKVAEGSVSAIYMDELSRMGRTSNREDGFNEWIRLYNAGVELYFLKTPLLNTSTYRDAVQKSLNVDINTNDSATDELISSIVQGLNKYIVALAQRQIYMAFDEAASEREYLSKRTSEGMKVAAMEGKQIGRKRGIKINTKKSRRAMKFMLQHYYKFGGSLNAAQCIRICNISKETFYTYLRELEQETQN